MSQHTTKRLATLRRTFTSALLLAGALPAAGADWQFPATDPFYDLGANWSTAAAPGVGDAADFLGSNTGTVFWDDITGDTISASILVDQAQMTFANQAASTTAHLHTTENDTVVSNGGILDIGLNVTELMYLDVGGNLDLRDTGQFNAGFGSRVSIGGNLLVGDNSGQAASATIDGAGTMLTVTGFTSLGFEGSTGTLSFTNGAVGDLMDKLTVSDGSVPNTAGVFNVTGGSVVTTGVISAGDVIGAGVSGTILVDGAGSRITQTGIATFTLGASSLSTGTLTVSNNGVFEAGTGTAAISTTGVLNLETGGRFVGPTVHLAGTVNLNTGGTLVANTINHTNGGIFNFTGGTLSVETFNGNIVSTGGALRPGGTPGDADTIGTTTINGDYTQNAAALLALGTKSDGSFDRLVVTGHLEIAGDLIFNDDEGFAFNLGGHLDLIDWGTLGGAFDTITLFDISAFNGLAWNTEDLYNTGEVSFELEGDLNTDGFVGLDDLDILLAHWGETSYAYNFAGGDTSGDGLAGQDDLDLIIDNWGNGTAPGGNVPEPGSAALLGLALLSFARRRRRA